MSRSHSLFLLTGLGLSLLLFAAPRTHAQVQTNGSGDLFYIGGSHTIDSTHSVVRDAYVGFDSGFYRSDSKGVAFHPTVNLVSGGSIGNAAYVAANSTFNMRGGSVGDGVYGYDSSIVNISGGSIGTYVQASDHNVINVTGGSIGREVFAENSGIINFFGTGFTYKTFAPDPTESEFRFSGTLLDGTKYIRQYVFIGNEYPFGFDDKVNLIDVASGFTTTFNRDGTVVVAPTISSVPEPGTVALLAAFGSVGGGLLLRRRRN